MKKAIKFLFGILFIFCSCIFTSIYIMSGSVAENYKVNRPMINDLIKQMMIDQE